MRLTKGYRPLNPNYLEIRPSDVHGYGVFATTDIKAGVVLGVSHVEYRDAVWRTPLGGFVNHSTDPNAVRVPRVFLYNNGIVDPMIQQYAIKLIKDVTSGEEITLTYMDYDPQEGDTDNE